jgi:hypothetical protein
VTKEEVLRAKKVLAAYNFVKKYYPGLLGRVTEDDMIQLLTIGHILFKSNPEYLEATTPMRQTPTQ